MKKTITLSALLVLFSACSEINIQEPTNNQNLIEYLNSYNKVQSTIFGDRISNPIKSVFAYDDYVIFEQNPSTDKDFINFIYNTYSYCNFIGGKSIIKKRLLHYLDQHEDLTLFGRGKFEEFISLRNKLNYNQVPTDGIFTCDAGNKTFEIVNAEKSLFFEENYYDRTIRKIDKTDIYRLKFKNAQTIYFNAKNNNSLENITGIKINQSHNTNIYDPRFYTKQYDLFKKCLSNDGEMYIKNKSTEYKYVNYKKYLTEYFDANFKISPEIDYSLTCNSKIEPFTFIKTHDFINHEDLYKAAKYSLKNSIDNIQNDKNKDFLDEIAKDAFFNEIKEFSTIFYDYKIKIISIDKHRHYIAIQQHEIDNSKNIKSLFTYSMINGKLEYTGSVEKNNIDKAKQILENNAKIIMDKCSLNLKDFNVNGYAVSCNNDLIFIKKDNKLHYINDN